MSTLDQLIQDTKERWERDFARQEGELIALERDMNKTGERYGITTNDTDDSMASDSDTDGIRPAEVRTEAVQEGRSKPANRELTTEGR